MNQGSSTLETKQCGRNCITKREMQSVLNLQKACFTEVVGNDVVFEAVRSLIYEIGRVFLSVNIKITPLDNCHAMNIKDREKKSCTKFPLLLGVPSKCSQSQSLC